MASKIQAALEDAKTFQQMMAMDGEIPIGKPNEENNFGLMGSEAQRYKSANYVVTVTGKDQHPYIIGCFRSHMHALALMQEEFERIKDHAEFTGDTKKNANDPNRPHWRTLDVENFIDKETGARYDIIPSALCEPPSEYASMAIVEVKDGVPTNVEQYVYNMEVRNRMREHWNDAKEAGTGESYTKIPSASGHVDSVTSVTLKDGTKYFATPAIHRR